MGLGGGGEEEGRIIVKLVRGDHQGWEGVEEGE